MGWNNININWDFISDYGVLKMEWIKRIIEDLKIKKIIKKRNKYVEKKSRRILDGLCDK